MHTSGGIGEWRGGCRIGLIMETGRLRRGLDHRCVNDCVGRVFLCGNGAVVGAAACSKYENAMWIVV